MPDPISPIGVTGQIQPLIPTPSPAAQTVAEGGAAQSPAVAQAATVLGLSDAARQELEKAQSKAGPAPVSLEDAVKAFRDYLKNLPSDLQFQPDKESGYVIFKVVNPVTQEVIRQYPPDEVVRMARHLKAAAQQGRSGIFLDEKL